MPLTRDLHQSEPVCTDSVRPSPDVDFRRLPHDNNAIGSIRDACKNSGYFVLQHVIDDLDVIAGTLDQMQRFFSLDDDDARKKQVMVTTKENKNGWTPMFGEPAYQPGTVAHLESFDCGRPGSSPGNVWPDLPHFRRDIRHCWHALADIGDVVLESLALAADLEPGRFRDHCRTHELSTMRLLNYPANDARIDETNVGIAAHTDFECITLILQTAPGLELRDPAGNWIDAPSDAGQIVVLLGDMVENWTNGHYQATGHRVRNSNSQRYSIVMFFAVDDGVSIGPLADFVSANRPASYPTTNQRDHLDREVRQAERHRDERNQ